MKENHRIPFVEFWLKAYTQQGSVMLDIGCGTAQYRTVTQAKYLGLDITNEDYKEGYPRNVDFVASATEIPMEMSSCDLLFSVSAFYQIPDYIKALEEFYRVLKPGGRILLFDYNKRTQKVLQIKEGYKRPCWTQWGLKKIVQKAGFKECELLLAKDHKATGIIKEIRLIHQELHGQWAIVTGIK